VQPPANVKKRWRLLFKLLYILSAVWSALARGLPSKNQGRLQGGGHKRLGTREVLLDTLFKFLLEIVSKPDETFATGF
jgi:hypothetical protein